MSHVRVPRYNALIRRGIDDRDLYRRALGQVREPGLQALLQENLHTLDALIADLQKQMHSSGHVPARHGTLAGALRSALAELTTGASANRDAAWIHCLARNECALLRRFEEQMAHASDESARVLSVQLSRLHGIHSDIHCLAGTTHG
ncbi:PA2169 family four-helix-bundle protein [Dyella solisilvae]|uniref:PA2169 family four-helix-bundle protein n=1 Tax=Dyella solisilvae TaxID=1920168 RepID=A0A370K7G5_9GAMM|nr:PA2169 family four-helix-bundle protein [Dyella solisilvae]RDI98564.1 PA2169 family four-helix-bundle protein [Dyella solisilvae]